MVKIVKIVKDRETAGKRSGDGWETKLCCGWVGQEQEKPAGRQHSLRETTRRLIYLRLASSWPSATGPVCLSAGTTTPPSAPVPTRTRPRPAFPPPPTPIPPPPIPIPPPPIPAIPPPPILTGIYPGFFVVAINPSPGKVYCTPIDIQYTMNGVSVDITHLKKGEVNLGTSIMAVNFKNGVILGADSRTTTGSYIANRVTDKLTQIHDTIYCCRSGSAADTQAVADMVKYYLQVYSSQLPVGENPTTEIAANVFQEICYNNKDNLTAGIICAGWDKQNGGSVYSIPIGGSIHKQQYAIAGSGSTFIYGWCNENYKPDMEKDECVKFIKTALSEAIKWDGSSGGVIRMVILTESGVERLIFYPDEYQK